MLESQFCPATLGRVFRRLVLTLLSLLSFDACNTPHACLGQDTQQKQSRPNVLMIAIDDLNDWVGCLGGHPNALTPNIDRLASQGILFQNAHCQAPICGPSRASLFTGLLPSTTGIYGQINDTKLRKATEAELMPDYFERFGYRTIACGKLFHGGDRAKVFDQYGGQASFGPKPKKRMKYDPAWFPEKIGGTQTDWGAFPDQDAEMPDYKIAQYGVEQLNEPQQQPFFLALGFMRPHVPWHVPQVWFDKHPIEGVQLPPYLADDLDDVPSISRQVNELPAMPSTEWAIKNKEWRNIVQSYLACTTFVDAQVGKVLEALDNSPYAENTIVILWSDHGYHVGEKNRFAKQALWDRANRIPFIVRLPDGLPNTKCEAPVGLIDIYPTLVELCGLPVNASNEGRSLATLLDNPDATWNHAVVTTYGQNNHALQTRTHRFYQYEDGSQELYDHRSDRNEWHNLASEPEQQALIDALQEQLPSKNAEPSPLIKYPTNEYFLAK